MPPINPTEDAEKHMFVYNNIFFSYAYDTRERGRKSGGSKKGASASTSAPSITTTPTATGKPDEKVCNSFLSL